MRQFYSDEGPLDTLLQIAAEPTWDGNLLSKQHRDSFVQQGWVARCEGYNIITSLGQSVIRTLRLCRMIQVPAYNQGSATLTGMSVIDNGCAEGRKL